ncbi:23S ribosomal RNA methyltransferase Erm [Mycobacterium riyadhense]|uniref:Ribosomal RNA adenine methylase transferase N-terminal domain-containing protein n=1 Tax=Mycobacterium riyadhense TaxID=486698 RepID=A0A1X2AW43_9MYCO|nr:23S ribosomal RNA methyltransferase Erm [Mycobacterium riyadhense]MCV7147398.1 23S ribosomal RNA methyltransferase Erm [Mycobacterium riyadhense]ORW55618.1 hypothetical protein AWC22_07450 [Mycobacterium riyadhense]VTP02896.1 rRNA methyltransferase [Mycobacterium riyadhense]
MPTYSGGRHEHGQNFLTDTTTINKIVKLVRRTEGPIVEIGPGRGALTFDLQELGRPLTVVEIDQRQARWLSVQLRRGVHVVNDDFLNWQLPDTPHVVVGSLLFHQTTAMMRKLLHAGRWTDAILLVQWEVARRRAGVGGATMMTAQWWPWITFRLEARVPATAFKPRPSVDAGLLTMSRRRNALVDPRLGNRYRAFVHAAFTGKGRGLPSILARLCERGRHRTVEEWLVRENIKKGTLPKDLSAQQWAELFSLATPRGQGPAAAQR